MKRLLCKATNYLIPLLLVLCLAGQASACSLFYFGGDFTDDGANLFFRGEDQDGADENKLYLVTPAGTNKAGIIIWAALALPGFSPTTTIAISPAGMITSKKLSGLRRNA